MFDISVIERIIHIQIGIDFIANGLIYLAGLLWAVELIPQVIKTIKTKDVNGISTSFFVLCLAAYIIYMFANALLGNWSIVITHIPSLILLFTMLILVLKYRRKNEKNSRKLNKSKSSRVR